MTAPAVLFSRIPAHAAALALALCAAGASAVMADEEAAADEDPYDLPIHLGEPHRQVGVEYTFTPGVWIPRLKGDVALGSSPSASDISVHDQLDLGGREAAFNAELAIRKYDYWELHFGGFHFSTRGTGKADVPMQFGEIDFAPGDRFGSRFSMTSVSGELRFGTFQAYHYDERNNSLSSGHRRVDFRFSPKFGARYIDIDQEVTRIGGMRERTGGEWIAPYGGMHFELVYRPDGDLPLTQMLKLEAGAAAGPAFGGGKVGHIWQVGTGLSWYPRENVGFMFGYRLLEINADHRDFSADVGLQGLFLSGHIRF